MSSISIKLEKKRNRYYYFHFANEETEAKSGYVRLEGDAIFIPTTWIKKLRLIGIDVLLNGGRGWKGSSVAGSSPTTGPRSTWPKESGRHLNQGHYNSLGHCRIFWG